MASEEWKRVWRNGFAPLFPEEALEALKVGLAENDPKLIQGQTTFPLPTPQYSGWVCEGADAVAYGYWRSGLLGTVGDIEDRFAALCFEVDQRLGGMNECRHFLNWWDDVPRQEGVMALLSEVKFNLSKRKVAV